jgi:phospholipase/carboxylesterase
VPDEIREETSLIESRGWVARVRPPSQSWNGRVILLIHGWTGDENSMWFFARGLPVDSWLVSPRAPLVCPAGGFAWGIGTKTIRPDLQQFSRQSDELIKRLPGWVPDFTPQTRLDVIGFSQGAAMTYTLCMNTSLYKVAPLAGYLPSGFIEKSTGRDFSSLRMFIAHNVDDEMLPIEESQKARDLFQSLGSDVQYMEGKGGHKMNTSALKAFNVFMRD